MKNHNLGMNLIAWALLLSVSSGCKTYMHFKYGLTQPREETPGSLMSFLEKNNFPRENIYIFSDSAYFGKALRNPLFSKNFLSHMIFNRAGKLLQRDTAQCQWSGYDVVKSLDPDSVYATCPDLQLADVLPRIRHVGNDTMSDDLTDDPDFTVIVTWAKFIGKYNSRLFVLSGAVKENDSAVIRLIWLNIDMQKSWKLTEGQKMAIR